MVFGFGVSGVDRTGYGVPLCSPLDHLLLEPFHLKGNTKHSTVFGGGARGL